MLHGGLKAKDKVTRNINRLAVFLMCCAIIVVVSLVVIRYSIKENFWCPISLPCDRTCAKACTPCSSCIDKGHWWCFQPRANSEGFCSHEDGSKDDFYSTEHGRKPMWTPSIACSQSCGCNGCLNGGGNWCRFRKAQRSFDGDDGYCDMRKMTQGQDRTPSENPDLCSASSCCCDSQGCHPSKCST